ARVKARVADRRQATHGATVERANPAPTMTLFAHQTRSSALVARGLMCDQRPDLKPRLRLMIARFVVHTSWPIEEQRQRDEGWKRDIARCQSREIGCIC